MVLNIAYSSDENYCCHLGTSILSLIENNPEFDWINIFVLDNGISESNKSKLYKIVDNHPANLFICDYSLIKKFLRTDNTFPISAFGRLFLDEFVPDEKVIYLDCDSVVNGSFFDLYSKDMGENICFAVQDTVDKYYKTSIGLNNSDLYFNSGFLVIDLNKWRQENMQAKAIAMIDQFQGSVPHHDQGVINYICRGRIKRVHPKYNFQCNMFEYKPEELNALVENYYSPEEIIEANESPVFIHFTESFSNRPWRTNCSHPYKGLYLNYRSRTPFPCELEDIPKNKKAEIIRKMYYRLPFPVYRQVLKLIQLRKRILNFVRT